MDAEKAPVVVGCAVDHGWALPLTVMLRSAEENLASDRSLHAFVVDGGIGPAERERVTASLAPSTQVEWLAPEPADTAGLPTWGPVSGATYFRLSIGRYLPAHVARVLWLDCDLLIFEDLSKLFDRANGGAVLLAAQDAFVKLVSSPYGLPAFADLGLAPDQPYFNAGVMLIDLDRWREAEVERRAREYLDRYGERVLFYDQDALNGALATEWQPLEPRWNWSANRMVSPPESLGTPSPAILHFSGARKPWRHGGVGPWYEAYLACLDSTAWRGARAPAGFLSRLALRYEQSPLRSLTYPAENLWLRARSRLERRRLD